jgi:hypothetical protein
MLRKDNIYEDIGIKGWGKVFNDDFREFIRQCLITVLLLRSNPHSCPQDGNFSVSFACVYRWHAHASMMSHHAPTYENDLQKRSRDSSLYMTLILSNVAYAVSDARTLLVCCCAMCIPTIS